MARLMLWGALSVTAIGVLLFHARQGGEPRASVPAPATSAALSPDQQQALRALRSQLAKSSRFAPEATREKQNAKLFTLLAETSEAPHEIEAALQAIPFVYASRPLPDKAMPDAELDRVLLKHTRSERASIALAAIAAARIPLMTDAPSEELTVGVAALAAPEQNPARRQSALEALNWIRPDLRGSHVLSTFESALSATEPHLISQALSGLAESGPSLDALASAQRDRLGARVLELTAHDDPGVRGHALAVIAAVEGLLPQDRRVDAARARLEDAHSYVRARAADLYARCGDPAAIHHLIEHVYDLSPARYDLVGWARLDGTPGSIPHVVPGRRRVGDAALYAIATLSERLPGAQTPQLTLGGPRQSDDDVRENAEIVQAWYRRWRTTIPRSAGAK